MNGVCCLGTVFASAYSMFGADLLADLDIGGGTRQPDFTHQNFTHQNYSNKAKLQ